MRTRLAAFFAYTVVGGVLAAAALASTVPQPDGEVKRKGKSFQGAGVINNSGEGQSAGARLEQGEQTTFIFRYTNADGETADDFLIGGCSPPSGFRVGYRTGGEDVTDEVNAGTLEFPDVAPGETTPKVRADVKVRPSAMDGVVGETCVPGVAATPPNLRDEPEWRVRVE